MASCECCWSNARTYAASKVTSIVDEYDAVLADHETRSCVCTEEGPEGDRARAGQFWDEERGVDRREAP